MKIEICRLWVDSVAKVFLGCRTKILRAADAFYARRREGPYRFIQNRSRTSVAAFKSDAAAEKSKDQLSLLVAIRYGRLPFSASAGTDDPTCLTTRGPPRPSTRRSPLSQQRPKLPG